jgi:hypothetical protein
MQGEIVGFEGDSVILKRPNGTTFSVRFAYLIKSNRVDLDAERNRWKEVHDPVRLRERREKFFATQCLITGTVFQKSTDSITVKSQLGDGRWATAPYLYDDIRDVDKSSVHVGDRVRFFCYEAYTVKVTTLDGEERQRMSRTIKVPEEFKSDPRTILPDPGNDELWHAAHPSPALADHHD